MAERQKEYSAWLYLLWRKIQTKNSAAGNQSVALLSDLDLTLSGDFVVIFLSAYQYV